VRHKALDAVGDLSLSGAPIIGLYRTYRPGHKLNAMALEALFAHRSACQLLEAPAPTAPVRVRVGSAHVPAGAAAFAAAD
jgi:UDP-3-O-[3-hydroxymyristoyl] N-acetylglucosamine deacetylase